MASRLPPFAGGLVGYLGYDLGRRFERLPSIARVDQHLPVVRLGLYDWAIAWDRRRGEAVLAARVVDGDTDRMGARIRDVLDRVDALARGEVPAARADVRVRHDGGIDERIPAVAPDAPGGVRVGDVARGLDRRRRGGALGDRAGRDLPGEPHPQARGAVRRRPVAAVPTAADR